AGEIRAHQRVRKSRRLRQGHALANPCFRGIERRGVAPVRNRDRPRHGKADREDRATEPEEMTALTILVRLLTENAGVTAIVGDRVFALMRPQESALPALVVQSIYEEQDSVIAGHRSGYTNRLSVE